MPFSILLGGLFSGQQKFKQFNLHKPLFPGQSWGASNLHKNTLSNLQNPILFNSILRQREQISYSLDFDPAYHTPAAPYFT